MSLSTQPYKGARDFYPEDKRIQKFMFQTMRRVVERFGYEEYDAPIIEPVELFESKGSAEIISQQAYVFEDRGGRKVTLRPEMTPTVSRLVAGKRQELGYPLRWYSIPNLWRYERPQRGRFREHWQLNVDIFGVANLEAEHEIIQVADNIMKAFGAKASMYEIRINSRKLINTILADYLKLDATQALSLIRLIDRIDKLEHEKFVAELDVLMTPTQRENGVSGELLKILKAKKLSDLPKSLETNQSVIELKRLFDLLDASSIDNYKFSISLMRGFDYYTDIVFEVYDTNPENNRSMFGGGRYDGLVSLFGVEPVPTVGFGMGDATLKEFLAIHELLPELKPETELYVALIGGIYTKALPTINQLRDNDIKVAVDISGSKLDKQLKTAVKKNMKYVVVIGEDELKSGQYKLRNLNNGEEETHDINRIASIITDYRNK